MEPHRRDPARRAAIAIGLVFFVNGATFASWFPRLPEVRDRLDVSASALGLTLLGGGLGGLAVSLLSGRIVDRVGGRAATVSTSIGLSVLLPIVALAGAPPALFAALIVLGALDGLTDVAMNSQAVQLQRTTGRSKMSRFHALWSTGAVVGGIVASRAAASGISLRAQLVVTAGALVTLTILAARWLLPRAGPVAVVDGQVTPQADRRRWALLTRLFVVGVAVALTEIPPNDWAALMLADRFDVSAARAGLGFVAIAGGMLAGRLAGDVVTDRLGLEGTRRGGALVALVGTVTATSAPNVVVAGVGLAIAGIGISALFPVMFRTAGELTAGSSTGMAAFSSGARLGILASSPLVGALADLRSVATGVLLVSGVAAALVAVSSLPQVAERQIAELADRSA